MTLLAGFVGLLQRWTGVDDLAVGTPIAGRTRMEHEPLIGFFVNTLVLRADLSGDPDAAELLERVREATLAAFAHQEVPFERLVEELAPERDLGRSPLVQALFVLQNAPMATLELPGLALAASAASTGMAKLELTCMLTETEHGLAGTLEYSTDLFDAATIERLAAGFRRLLAAMAAEPRARLSELPLLGAAELHQAAREWSDSGRDWNGAGLSELLEAGPRGARWRRPSPAARRRSAYAELHRRANQLAHRLRRLGSARRRGSGCCWSAPWRWSWASWGCSKAGGAYVPLDPAFPPERLALHGRGRRARRPADRRRSLAEPPRHRARPPVLEAGRGAGAAPGRARPLRTRGRRPGQPRLRALHLGLDRHAQGGGGRARAVVNFLAAMRERPGLAADDMLLAVTTHLLRHRRPGDLPAARRGRPVVLARRGEARRRRAPWRG